ncbi:S-norcoclaurine synthase 1-like [Tripterygium wilfordii]|uniref:S-norcoclaurine synthase 1-like n=1 Tax=Tripterygium wilfordii TaxID=458696 RepID=UPI0018F842FC|nr:S-norcoclaurine synthase 1-like [Tripterygium wilfordii]
MATMKEISTMLVLILVIGGSLTTALGQPSSYKEIVEKCKKKILELGSFPEKTYEYIFFNKGSLNDTLCKDLVELGLTCHVIFTNVVVVKPEFKAKDKAYIFWSRAITMETLNNYSSEVNNLALAILEQMEKALKVSNGIKEAFADGAQQMQFNYYPPCPQSEKVIGLSPHSDMGITVLLQVNDVEGLQIKKNGKWLTIKPIPSALIINLGDMIEKELVALKSIIKNDGAVERRVCGGWQKKGCG